MVDNRAKVKVDNRHTNKWTERQTNRRGKNNMPQIIRSWGHKNENTKYKLINIKRLDLSPNRIPPAFHVIVKTSINIHSMSLHTNLISDKTKE